MLTAILVSLACGLLLGAIVARVLSRREVAKRVAAEQRAQSAERLAELGSMTGGLAHEIKNPLSTIGLNAQLLAEGIAELPEGEALRSRLSNRVGALRRETERLRGILQDFLDYAGNVRLEKQPTNLTEMLRDMVEFLTPEAERAGVRLRLDVPSDATLMATIDQRLIKQALLNLLLNAIQAISAGRPPATPGEARGEVILRARGEVSVPGGSAGVRIEVNDTGPGIAADAVEKIFRPYFTTKAGGTGLGLPTSRRFVQEHGGTLTCVSEPGRGTSFVVVLPA